ncbi:MAG: SGNH/GDSL hydrolase family protein [Chitinophagales bacterium]
MKHFRWLIAVLAIGGLAATSLFYSFSPPAKAALPERKIGPGSASIVDSLFTVQSKILRQVGKKRKVLLIGDSMLEGLCSRLTDYFEHAGFETNTLVWYGGNSKAWCRHDTLKTILDLNKPDFVVFSNGTNELLMPYIHLREPYIVKLKEALAPYRFAWIGPPNWKEDTGINFLIDSTLNKQNFYYSGNLKLGRLKDGIHPNKDGNQVWADSIVSWVNANYSDFVYLSRPDTFRGRMKNYHFIPTSYLFVKE